MERYTCFVLWNAAEKAIYPLNTKYRSQIW
jgi:hypothetical protein